MKNLIKIYSHPRSGTHFLEAFLAKNFYSGFDLSSEEEIYFGHWSNKILLPGGEPFHKLFGAHSFPQYEDISSKSIYIYRDGRSVISSIYNSKFYNKEWMDLSFSEFLRKDLDWYGGLGQKKKLKMNIVQHWYQHVDAWSNLENKNILIIRYEDLKKNPEETYFKICRKFYPLQYLKERFFFNKNIDPISNKVGIKPNKAQINGWKNLFNDEDLDFFYSQLPSRKYLFEEI